MLTAFGGLLLATVLVVIVYLYSNTSRMVLMLCDDLMEQTSQAVINRTIAFFTPVTALTEMSSQIAPGMLLPSNSIGLERYAIRVLNAYPTVAGFIFGDRAGSFLMARRLPDGTTSTKTMDRTMDPPVTTWRTRDKAFNLIKTEHTISDTFDPRLRPWYQGAKENRHLYLTDIYIFYTDRVPGITVSYPILDSQGSVLAVTGCDIELSGLSTFLKSLRIGEHGLAMIINERNEIVAFPDAARVIDSQTEHGVLPSRSLWRLWRSPVSLQPSRNIAPRAPPEVPSRAEAKNTSQPSGTFPLPLKNLGKWSWWFPRTTLSAGLNK